MWCFFKALKIMGYAFFQIILIILFVPFSSSFLTSISAAEKVRARDTRICDPCCVSISLEGCGREPQRVRSSGSYISLGQGFSNLITGIRGVQFLGAVLRMTGCLAASPSLPTRCQQHCHSPTPYMATTQVTRHCPMFPQRSCKSLPVENQPSRGLQFIKCFHIHFDYYLILSLIKIM